MSIKDEVLILTDRFYSSSDPDAVGRQSRLEKCLLIVLMIHITTMIALWRGAEFEKSIPHAPKRDINVDVSFMFNLAPSEPVVMLPPPRLPSILNPGEKADDERFLIKPPVKKTQVKTRVPSIAGLTPPISQVPSTIKAVPNQVSITGSMKNANRPGGETGNVEGGVGPGVENGVPIAVAPPPSITTVKEPEKRDIAPYRKQLLISLSRNWHPVASNHQIIVEIVVAKSGEVLSASVVQSSGRKKYDREALRAVSQTAFEPLPDWYRGNQITFHVDMTSMMMVRTR